MDILWWTMRHFGEAELESHTTVVVKSRTCPQFQSGLMENNFFLFFSLSVLILPLLLILLYEVHFSFVQSSPYDAVFHIWDQNNVDKTSELLLSLNSACAVFRLFLALSLFLFHTFFTILFEILLLLSNWLLPFKSRFCSLCVWIRQLRSHSGTPGRGRVDECAGKD